MNLFLGYYLPSQNTQPLWELDNDYYLHNFHVNAGRGSLQSMKAYQSMFGVDWSDLEDDHKVDQDRHRAHRRNESVGSTISIADDPARIDRVKQRCIAQNYSLSVWWKVGKFEVHSVWCCPVFTKNSYQFVAKLAIQNYLQQRMWMQLGGNHEGSSLPPRFERLYRPTELSHFDKVFGKFEVHSVRCCPVFTKNSYYLLQNKPDHGQRHRGYLMKTSISLHLMMESWVAQASLPEEPHRKNRRSLSLTNGSSHPRAMTMKKNPQKMMKGVLSLFKNTFITTVSVQRVDHRWLNWLRHTLLSLMPSLRVTKLRSMVRWITYFFSVTILGQSRAVMLMWI